MVAWALAVKAIVASHFRLVRFGSRPSAETQALAAALASFAVFGAWIWELWCSELGP